MLTTADLTEMRADVADSLLDECVIGTAGTQSGVEPTNGTYSYSGSAVACGFSVAPSGEGSGDAPQVSLTDAKLRLPLTATVGNDSRIKLTSRHGTAVTEYYAVMGEPKRGHTLFVCELRRLTGGNAR